MHEENNSFTNYGGTVNGPVAVGHRARAVMTAAQPLVRRLDELIDAHEAQVTEPRLARRDVADVRQELEQPEPDRDRVLDALKRLAGRAGQVTAILDVIDRVRELLP